MKIIYAVVKIIVKPNLVESKNCSEFYANLELKVSDLNVLKGFFLKRLFDILKLIKFIKTKVKKITGTC